MTDINTEQADAIQVLSAKNQILKKPQMWLGAMTNTEFTGFYLENSKLKFKTVSYVPGLLKCINEVLDNSIDAINRFNKNSSGSIKIEISKTAVKISDTGPGIPIVKKKLSEIDSSLPESERIAISKEYIPQSVWTRLFSGANYSESENNTTIGTHGVGVKLVSIFSKEFIGTTINSGKKCTVHCRDNMSDVKCNVTSSTANTGTCVEFYPDLERFGLTEIEQVYIDLINQRLNCLSVSFPGIKFYFQKKLITYTDKNFLKEIDNNIQINLFNTGFIGVFPNSEDEFNFFTYVNGLHLTRGGKHIEYIINEIATRIKNKLSKKYKAIKIGDIKQKLSLVVFLKDFKNPKYDSQTKETLTNSISEVINYLKDKVDFDSLAKNILKSNAIIDPIIEGFKIKELIKSKAELKVSRKLKISSEKYLPPIGENGSLFLCEGLSALSNISACLGRKNFAYYAMRGVPLNAYSSSFQKIGANAELKDIVNILNLNLFEEGDKKISYDKIVISTDADCLSEDTTVLIKGRGYTKIKDVVPGMQIADIYNRYITVTNVVERKTKELATIYLCNGEHIKATIGHGFYAWDYDNNQQQLCTVYTLSKLNNVYLRTGTDNRNWNWVKVDYIDTTLQLLEETVYDITVDSSDHMFAVFSSPINYCAIHSHNCDGSFITSQLIGLFKKFAPNLFKEGKIQKLVTPICLLKDNKGVIKKYFFKLNDFKQWEMNNPNNKLKVEYLKGLGSIEKEDLNYIIEKDGLESLFISFDLNKGSEVYIEDWLGTDTDNRKKYLREYVLDINTI